MAQFVGRYQHHKNENIDDYFTAVGVPYIGRKMLAASSPVMEITYDNEFMTIKYVSLLRTVESTFKFGVEYDEYMPGKTIKSVTTLINDSEFETKSLIPDNGVKSSRHFIFSENDEVIVVHSHSKGTVPGKRYFRKIK
ncbi:hypothetical protein K1T71_004097 [Dendrolimus kikuchii]|uniref:Uncharacterized protein n=1 Tax=Dendrolimus kikuchii TaxID=765133 RepID=A0ACC1D9U2_9NEOP|nr:hypothetical protein K1T71_004097 [Dendrolimus kikuchii]